MAQRFGQPTNQRAAVVIPRGLLAAAVLAAVACGLAFVAAGPLLATRTVQVRGYDGPDAEQVNASLAAIARSGSALRLAQGMVDEYIRQVPLIRRATIVRTGLTGAQVQVQTRTPVAIAHGRGAPVAVASDGMTIRTRGSAGLATVRWMPQPEMHQALDFLAELPPALRGRVRALALEQGQLQGRLEGGGDLRLGDPQGAHAKGQSLTAVWRRERAALDAARYVDLSVPERVILGPERG